MSNKFNLKELIKYFNLELKEDNKKYFGHCFLHGGDNPNAFCIYKDSGKWFCWSHHCEKKYGGKLDDLIKILVQTTGVKLDKSIKFIERQLDTSNIEKREFIRQAKILSPNKNYNWILKYLEIPSIYYINRGFSLEILEQYQVGRLNKIGHKFHNRTIVPIFDNYCENIIGYTARVEYELCRVCNKFHNLYMPCPNDKIQKAKWSHSDGLKTSSIIYNYCNAFGYILETGILIILEGPPSLWKLEMAGIHNGIAIFGSSISRLQVNLLKKLNIKKIIIGTDNDAAGENASNSIKEYMGNRYEYINLELNMNDIGEMQVDEIKELFNAYI